VPVPWTLIECIPSGVCDEAAPVRRPPVNTTTCLSINASVTLAGSPWSSATAMRPLLCGDPLGWLRPQHQARPRGASLALTAVTDTPDAPDTNGRPDEQVLAALGVTDRATAQQAATDARQVLIDGATDALKPLEVWSIGYVVLSGLVARAQGLHEGALAAIAADNPYAAFTLVRAYAENAAAVLYVKDHPDQMRTHWLDANGRHVPIGKMTRWASASNRFGGFRSIYDQLSGFAHPSPRSIISSHRLDADAGETDGTRRVTWRSAPSFKTDEDAMVACGWIVELATAQAHLLVELADVVRRLPASQGD
jgi:hypothetical protein